MIQALTTEGKLRIERVLSRAATDIEFREALLRDPEASLAALDLSATERRALGAMRRVALEEWGVDVRRFRAFLRDNGVKAI